MSIIYNKARTIYFCPSVSSDRDTKSPESDSKREEERELNVSGLDGVPDSSARGGCVPLVDRSAEQIRAL